MKIIDLLNKIANGEETPKSFKYGRYTFTLDCDEYIDNDGDNLKASIYGNYANLNDEIEIIEDKKEIQKVSYQQIGSYLLERNEKLAYTNEINKQIHKLGSKINELVEEVNCLSEKVNSSE